MNFIVRPSNSTAKDVHHIDKMQGLPSLSLRIRQPVCRRGDLGHAGYVASWYVNGYCQCRLDFDLRLLSSITFFKNAPLRRQKKQCVISSRVFKRKVLSSLILRQFLTIFGSNSITGMLVVIS